ncbi:hypothetical protein CXG52_26205 [Pseudomonas plecoglossicida]|nr:hypothetical protein CXG52_26205 [Pseudomonas plecoglossicida]
MPSTESLLRGHARSHRACTGLKACAVPVGAGSPANTGEAGAMHQVAFFAGKPAHKALRRAG